MSQPKRGALIVTIALITIITPTLVLPSVFDASYQLLRHAECLAATPAASGSLWTPVEILDSPPNFNNTTTYAIGSAWVPGVAPVYMNISDGEAGGMFSLDHWELVAQSLRWIDGPGSVPSCPQLVAEDLSRTSASAAANATFVELLPQGALSDASIPHTFNMSDPNGTEHPSVYFIANYSKGGFPGLPYRSITSQYTDGAGIVATTTLSEVGGILFVVVPFQGPAGKLLPFASFLSGVTSSKYVDYGPWEGCVQWANLPNPFGTGLSFGPAPKTGCTYP